MSQRKDIVILIQARMNSSRLPQKSMMKIGSYYVLEHLLSSLNKLTYTVESVVLTSELFENDKIRSFCKNRNIRIYSGDEENVASRFYNFLSNNSYKYFVRISGDSPLFDYRLLEEPLQSVDESDIYSTVYTNRFPSGMNFEIVRTGLFLSEYKKFHKPSHFEHVTKYFYEYHENYNIKQIELPLLPSTMSYNFCIDTVDDKINLEKIVGAMDKEHYEYNLYEKCLIYDNVIRGLT